MVRKISDIRQLKPEPEIKIGEMMNVGAEAGKNIKSATVILTQGLTSTE